MGDIELVKKRFLKTLNIISKGLGVDISQISREMYVRFSVDNNTKGRLNKEELNLIGGFRYAKNQILGIDIAKQKETMQAKKEETKEQERARKLLEKEQVSQQERENILHVYSQYVEENGITPTILALEECDITLPQVRRHFKNMLGLYRSFSQDPRYALVVESLINEDIFTEQYFETLNKKVSKVGKKTYFITTAVSGKKAFEPALRSIDNFLKRKKGQLLITPCEDVASRGSVFKYELDSKLRDASFVFKDLYLCENFHVSSIAVSAKQINPLTGLSRLAQAKGSAILASPKQDLKFVATSNLKIPHALMTTGAITMGDYSSDKSMSQRTSYIAEFDHKLGGIIVEIEDNNKIFHFRQVQFDLRDGSFYDYDTKYNADGTIEKALGVKATFGDTHVGSHDPRVDECLVKIVKDVGVEEIFVNDLFDNRFNNHHDVSYPVLRAMLAREGKTRLLYEGEITSKWLDDWSKRVEKIVIIKSNHDEALDRYIKEGRWLKDELNLYDALPLVRVYMDGIDPLKYLLESMVGLKDPNKIKWLGRDEDCVTYGINHVHGDKAGNGVRGSLAALENNYYKATVGHSHTAGILRNMFQVGTSTYLKLSYNSGPSSWTHTMCLEYPNGQRQLINMIPTPNGVRFKL